MEVNSGGYLPSRRGEVNNCFSIYHTSWITSGQKSNFICDNIPTKAILFFFGCSEVNSTWLITSELANQRARKVLFTCVVCTNLCYETCRIVFIKMTANSKFLLARQNMAQMVKIPLIIFHLARLIFTGQTNHLDMIYP